MPVCREMNSEAGTRPPKQNSTRLQLTVSVISWNMNKLSSAQTSLRFQRDNQINLQSLYWKEQFWLFYFTPKYILHRRYRLRRKNDKTTVLQVSDKINCSLIEKVIQNRIRSAVYTGIQRCARIEIDYFTTLTLQPTLLHNPKEREREKGDPCALWDSRTTIGGQRYSSSLQ